ncbi:MAG TPA: hypothetical protein VIR04_02310 [Paralcaligenes sp.]
MDVNRANQDSAFQGLTTTFALGFKFLAWINGVGALLIVACSIGVVQVDLSPYLLRLPLASFMAGLALCGLGLLWSYLVQSSLFNQLLEGRARRTHWVPMFCAMIAYSLSMAAFVMGCWFTLNLAAAIDQNGDYSQSSHEEASPSDQSGRFGELGPVTRKGVVLRDVPAAFGIRALPVGHAVKYF